MRISDWSSDVCSSDLRKRLTDIPPYIVPLSVQAMEIVRHMLAQFKPAQVYLFPGQNCLKRPISENTLNGALKRMGYEDQLTGHGIRARSEERRVGKECVSTCRSRW